MVRPSDAGEQAPRVLYFITNDISARFLKGQLAYLIDHGFEVSVGTKRSDPPAEFDNGVIVHEIPFVREPSLLGDARALVDTVRLIRKVRPNIVNASTPKAGLIGMIASWACRVPTRVYVVRGLRFETMSGARRRLFRLLELLSTAAATDVVFNSRSLLATAAEHRSVRQGRGVVLGHGSGNGIDAARFEDLPSRSEARDALGIPQGARVIGFVGRLTLDKGIVDLVNVFTEFPNNFMLLLVGDFERGDPVPSETRSLISTLPRIAHVPWVEDTRTVYPAMDVLAFPSYREGLPNVPLEAQLCGVPVTGYAATGTIDAVQDGIGGTLVAVGDQQALAQQLLHTACHESNSRLGREWVADRFSQPVVWQALLQTYAHTEQCARAEEDPPCSR